MATNVYSGLNGSGKSFEAVASVIVPNVKAGRRVVTNIKGINPEKVYQYIKTKWPEVDNSRLGQIVCVEDSAIEKPNFFPLEDTPLGFEVPDWIPLLALRRYVNSKGSLGPDALQLLYGELDKLKVMGIDLESALNESVLSGWKNFRAKYFYDRPRDTVFCATPDFGTAVVQPGDLVIIDEAWNFYEKSKPLDFDHMTFFRMHRHFVHPENGYTCDICLLTQNIGDLHPRILAVVETHFSMTKLKMVGQASRYRVDMYQGYKATKASLLKSFQRKYDKAIFPLYKSYDAAGASEKDIDSRLNLLTPKLFIGAILCFGVIGYGSWSVYRFFHPAPKVSDTVIKGAKGVTQPGAVVPPHESKRDEPSSARIAGSVTIPGGVRYVVVADQGVFHFLSPSQFTGDSGRFAVGDYRGQRVYFSPADRDSSFFGKQGDKK